MATFASWLAGNETGPQNDPVAWLARAWKSQEGKRPRVSSASGIEKHMLTLAAGDAAEQDQWTGYVHLAINAAVDKFRAEKSSPAGSTNTSSGEQMTLPGAEPQGTNPATGKPVAVISSAQWVQHPDASQYGSCGECGWPRGLAAVNGSQVITCAAGHVFVPAKPEPMVQAAGQDQPMAPNTAGLPGPEGPAGSLDPAAWAPGGQPDQETSVVLSGPVIPGVSPAGAGGPVAGPDGPDSEPGTQAPRGLAERLAGDQGVIPRLDMLSIKLDAILVSLGLPTDPGQLAQLLSQAIREAETGGLAPDQEPGYLLSAQLQPTVLDHADTEHAGLPPDFAAWYGVADPAAPESDDLA